MSMSEWSKGIDGRYYVCSSQSQIIPSSLNIYNILYKYSNNIIKLKLKDGLCSVLLGSAGSMLAVGLDPYFKGMGQNVIILLIE